MENKSKLKENMAKNLKALRKESGETQIEMANILDVSYSSYAKYESGDKMPRDEVKVRIADHFGKSVQEIFFS